MSKRNRVCMIGGTFIVVGIIFAILFINFHPIISKPKVSLAKFQENKILVPFEQLFGQNKTNIKRNVVKEIVEKQQVDKSEFMEILAGEMQSKYSYNFNERVFTFYLQTANSLYTVDIPLATIQPIVNNEIYKADTKRNIALTFDDGPDKTSTNKVLDILKKYNVHATFYLQGKNVVKYPEQVKRIKAEGHEIGTHFQNHLNLTKLSTEEIKFELNESLYAIYEAGGGFAMHARAPYGIINKQVADVTEYPLVNWGTTTKDWELDSKMIIARMRELAHPNDIVLLHSIQKETVIALPEIIERLLKNNYSLVTVEELYNGDLKAGYEYFTKNILQKI